MTETSIRYPEAQAVTDLVHQFRCLSDPASDPDAAVRTKLEDFLHRHLARKGSEGTNEDEAQAALPGEIESTPGQWPDDPVRLPRLLVEVFNDGSLRLPATLIPARATGVPSTENRCSLEVIDAALSRQFPTLRPNENAAAWRAETAVWQALRDRIDV